MRLDETAHFPRLYFTPEGLAALRRMMADPRLADPGKFVHIRQEPGIDLGRGPGRPGKRSHRVRWLRQIGTRRPPAFAGKTGE